MTACRRDSLREQEAKGELLVVAGRAHRHCDRLPVHPDLERLLDRHAVLLLAARHAHDLDAGRRVRRREVAGPVHVREQRRVELDDGRVELCERVAERQVAVREPALEHRERPLRVRAGERAGLRDGSLGTRRSERLECLRSHAWTVHGEEDADVGAGSPQARRPRRRAARARRSRRRRAGTAAAARPPPSRPRSARRMPRRGGATRARPGSRRPRGRAPSARRSGGWRRPRAGLRSRPP